MGFNSLGDYHMTPSTNIFLFSGLMWEDGGEGEGDAVTKTLRRDMGVNGGEKSGL